MLVFICIFIVFQRSVTPAKEEEKPKRNEYKKTKMVKKPSRPKSRFWKKKDESSHSSYMEVTDNESSLDGLSDMVADIDSDAIADIPSDFSFNTDDL